jgi:hypothetical protein
VPRRSKVIDLPIDIRQELERRLMANAFSDYEGLSAWLAEQGYELSRSAVHRYGQSFEDRVGALRLATEQARVLCESSPDDDGVMGEALMRLAQERMFGLLVEMEVDPEKVDITKLVRSISELSRSQVGLKQYQSKVRAQVDAAKKALDSAAKSGGISAETRQIIERELLGIP